MKKGPDPIVILVLVFVVGFVVTGVSKTDFSASRAAATAVIARG